MPRNMFDADISKIDKYEDDLKTFAERSFPFAVKNTLNVAAFDTQKRTKAKIKKNMINRNKFTVNSVQVEPNKTLNVNRMEAVVGSRAPYMEDQEFGGIKTKTGKHGVDIPTTVASGEGRGAGARRKKVLPSSRMSKIRLKNVRIKVKSKKQENAIRINNAIDSGRKFVFIDTVRTKGIYKISGGKNNTKIDMVHDLTRKTVSIPRNPTLGPATKETQKQMPFIYVKSLEFQVKRQGLFK